MDKQMIRLIGASYLISLIVVAGCRPAGDPGTQNADHRHSHDHEHSDTPKSLSAAIAELKAMWDQIRTAVKDSDFASAHEPLHEVGYLLQAMSELAADTDLSEGEWQEIKEQADQLFEAFSDIDSAFHKKDGDKQAAYDSAKSSIDEGIAELEAKLPLLGDRSSPAVLRHDHHDDEDHADHE